MVASAGGSNVGQNLLRAVVQASALLTETTPHRLVVFTGPYTSDKEMTDLTQLAGKSTSIDIRRFTDRFSAWLDAADLSVSMAGYNTTMNLLAAETYGLVLPFDQNREQRMRAERIEKTGALGVLSPDDLAPAHLARLMGQGLARQVEPHSIDLNGARKSAAVICERTF